MTVIAFPPDRTDERAGRVPPDRDHLLLAVAQALKLLLGVGALQDNIEQALRLLGGAGRMHRVKVILQQPVGVGEPPYHALTHEWWAEGFESQTQLGVVNFPDAVIAEYLRPLRAGQSVWRLIDEVSGDLRTAFEHVGMRSMGVVPVFAKARYAGMVAFDDCIDRRRWSEDEIEALTIAAHAIGAAIERESIEAARLHAEQARADQAESDSQALRQREALLQTVTEATRALLAGSDFDAGVRGGMALLGKSLGVIRVGLAQDLPLSLDDAPGRWRITHEWTEAGVPPQIGSPAEAGLYPSRDAWQRWRAGDAVVVRVDDGEASFAEGQRSIRTVSILAMPLFVGGRFWGLLGFDHGHAHAWAEHELAVLKTAAACVGAALERRDAESRRVAQRDVHAAQLQRHLHLLAAVAQSAEELLGSRDLPPCLDGVLAHIGAATNADRAVLVRLDWTPDDAELLCWQEVLNEWARPDRPWQRDTELQRFAMYRSDTTYTMMMRQLESDGRILVRIQDCGEPFRSQQLSLGIVWSLVYPVKVAGALWGLLGFDYATPFADHDEADLSALKAVASTISDALERERIEAERLAERERSANERAAELAQANASMRRTLARLAAAEDVDAFLSTGLLELRQQAGAAEAFLFAVGDPEDDRLLRLRGSIRSDGFHRHRQDGDPDVFSLGFAPTPESLVEMKQGSWLLWRPISGAGSRALRHPDVQRWLLERGHAAEACCLLQVGDRCVGLVTLHLSSLEPLSSSRCELLVALSQPMALALELGRLGRDAQRAAQDRAVLAERNRMARDVHDTLAQGFTAISLQLQAAARAVNPDDSARFLSRAIREAQVNLMESRRTIRLLRGAAEPGGEANALVQVIEDALASRLSGSVMAWRVLLLPEGSAEPALDPESRRELKRIAQEAATNALKHAGSTVFEACVTLEPDGSHLVVRLADRGCGFNPDDVRDGFGLLGMHERAERIGARLHVESQPGGPTAIVVVLPLASLQMATGSPA